VAPHQQGRRLVSGTLARVQQTPGGRKAPFALDDAQRLGGEILGELARPPRRGPHRKAEAREKAEAWAARPCEVCGVEFEPGQPSARYCSASCRQAAYRARRRVTA
jgi:hypothetical protein